MSQKAWPKSRGFEIGDIPLAFRFAAHPGHFRSMLLVALLLGLYVLGLYVPIPGTHPVASAEPFGWWFLGLLDSLVTGGALGRGCLFGTGMLAPLLLRAGKHMVLRGTVGFGAVLVLMTFTLRARGVVSPGFKPFVLVVLWLAVGGVAIKLINTRLFRHRGPAPFYINLFVTIVASLRGSTAGLLAAHRYLPLYLLAGSIVFITLSSLFLLRDKIRIEVESLKNVDTQHKSELEIAPIDELLLDSIGMMCLLLYLCLAGCVSLALGWRTMTPDNSLTFLCISVLAFLLVWWSFATLSRYRSILRLVDVTGILNLTDPHDYAMRMLNAFWIIPRVPAGPETEQYIGHKVAGSLRKAFILLASWVLIAIALQYIVGKSDSQVSLLPYGPLVFVFTVLMLIGNLSMCLSHIAGSLNQFRQLVRGQSRVLAETFPLGTPHATSGVALGAELDSYWEEEKISDQLDDVVDGLKILRDWQILQPKPERRHNAFAGHLQKWIASLVIGTVVTFVAGALCLLIWPDISRRDLGVVVLPMLVSSVFAPDVIVRLLKAIRLR